MLSLNPSRFSSGQHPRTFPPTDFFYGASDSGLPWASVLPKKSFMFGHEIGGVWCTEWITDKSFNELLAVDFVSLLPARMPRVYLTQSDQVMKTAGKEARLKPLVESTGLAALAAASRVPKFKSASDGYAPVSSLALKFALSVASRPPDAFEGCALGRLRRGCELVKMEEPARIRAFGAIRASQKCVRCHEGKPGDLLAAFTYFIARRQDESRAADYREMQHALRTKGSRGLTPYLERWSIPDSTSVIAFGWIARQGLVTKEMLAWQQAVVDDNQYDRPDVGLYPIPSLRITVRDFTSLNFLNTDVFVPPRLTPTTDNFSLINSRNESP